MSEPGAEARVGARWWADKMRAGFFPDAGARPGDAIAHPMAVGLIATLQAKQAEGITAEMIDAYEAALARRIQRMLDKGESRYGTAMKLGCDYGPGPAHREALEEAGIKSGMTVLPWKTVMWVGPGRVSVSDGYQVATVDLPLDGEHAPPADH